ncbi:MAG TPA: stage III sporulation protein AB [Peptococcaceae bacterium]|nr:stage III sporulation protein AB [Peptococcaceae bacterium]
MLKFGYWILIIGFGCLGLWKAAQIRKRPKEIRAMINALALLDTEIFWGVTPLPEAFRVLKDRAEPPWREFFAIAEEKLRKGENAASAWESTICEQKIKTCLTEDDWKIIKEIGKGLGRSDRNEQHKQLELAQKHLSLIDNQVSQQAEKKAKMWSYLGFLGGLAVVICII